MIVSAVSVICHSKFPASDTFILLNLLAINLTVNKIQPIFLTVCIFDRLSKDFQGQANQWSTNSLNGPHGGSATYLLNFPLGFHKKVVIYYPQLHITRLCFRIMFLESFHTHVKS